MLAVYYLKKLSPGPDDDRSEEAVGLDILDYFFLDRVLHFVGVIAVGADLSCLDQPGFRMKFDHGHSPVIKISLTNLAALSFWLPMQ